MRIEDYYESVNEEQIAQYQQEARQLWGHDVVDQSESRIVGMGKEKFDALQVEGDSIFKAISDNMTKGVESTEVQSLVAKWRLWLENLSHYSDDAVLGLGQMYSQNPEFADYFHRYHEDLSGFLTEAIEYYYVSKK